MNRFKNIAVLNRHVQPEPGANVLHDLTQATVFHIPGHVDLEDHDHLVHALILGDDGPKMDHIAGQGGYGRGHGGDGARLVDASGGDDEGLTRSGLDRCLRGHGPQVGAQFHVLQNGVEGLPDLIQRMRVGVHYNKYGRKLGLQNGLADIFNVATVGK